jgi:hypothetical protein
MGVGGQCQVLAALSLEKEMQYPLYRRLGGPQRWSGWAHKNSHSHLDSIPRTILPIACHSTDYAILRTPTSKNVKLKNTELEHK